MKYVDYIKGVEESFTTSYRTMAAFGYPLKGWYSVAIIAASAPKTLFYYSYRTCPSHKRALALALLEPACPAGSVLYCCVVGICTDDQCESPDRIHGMVRVLPDSGQQVI
jgi:hypothetical protein